MKYLTLILAASILFFSCKKNDRTTNFESTLELQIKNDRMVFKDRAAYENKVAEFDKKGLQASRELKEQFPGFKTLGEVLPDEPEDNDLKKFGFPHYLLSILNQSGEFRVGDTIIAYVRGYKYFIPGNDESILKKIRTDNSFANNYKLRTTEGDMPVYLQIISPQTQQRVFLPIYQSDLDARHQLQFWANAPAAGWRKYIHEIQSYNESWIAPGCDGFQWRSRLFLRMKLEYKGSKWRPAGETRNINYSVTGIADLMRGGSNGTLVASYPINSSGNVTQNFDHEVRLYLVDNQTICRADLAFFVTINGTIYQHIVGDTQSNEWFNTGTPLW